MLLPHLVRDYRGLLLPVGAGGKSGACFLPGGGHGRVDAAAPGPNPPISGGGAAGQPGLFYHVLEFRGHLPGNSGGTAAHHRPRRLGPGAAANFWKAPHSYPLYSPDAHALSGADVSPVSGAFGLKAPGYPVGGDPARGVFHLPCVPPPSVLPGHPPGDSGGGKAGRRRGSAAVPADRRSSGNAGNSGGRHPLLPGFLEHDRAAHDLFKK